jgi:hypothetical protein
MSKSYRLSLLPIVVFAVVACSGSGATASPSASAVPPSSAPSESPADFGAIEHATGKTDVLLRYEEGGGFMMPAFIATQAPIFTLYGDGTVIFRNPFAEAKQAVGSVFPQNPYRIAKLSEDQIQDTLKYALGDGGLGIAKASYEDMMISDASTAVFTVNAGGIKKTVSVYALGIEMENVPDAPARAAFNRLAKRLADFDQGGTIKTDLYQPERYRGILMDGFAAPDQRAWPWADIKPTDFPFPADPNAFQSAERVMTPAEVAILGLEDVEGGFQGLPLEAPDKSKLYSFSLRPLLPDEAK